MIFVYSLMSIAFCLSILLGFIGWWVSKISLEDREKMTPFECGFDIISSGRMSFSLRFFLIGIVFLIFDVEIVLLLPFPMLIGCINGFTYWFLFVGFLWVLVYGLMVEWFDGALDWV